MSLIRRLGIGGKFALVAVLLMVPLIVSAGGSFRQSATQVRSAQHERDGVTYVQPLVALVMALSHVRIAALEGRDPGVAGADHVLEVDAADALHGAELGVQRDWAGLRPDVQEVLDPATSRARVNAIAAAVSERTQLLIAKVTESANLIVDPQLDSHHLALLLVDRLPRVMLAAVTMQQLRVGREAGTRDALSVEVAGAVLTDAARQLAAEIDTALSTTTGADLRRQIGAPAAALGAAVSRTSTALAAGEPVARGYAQVDSLATSAGDLTNALADGLDRLLAQRQDRVGVDQLRLLAPTLATLLLAIYLLLALFRATTRDVRAVLEDISTVTDGAVYQTVALTGSDEFAEMSRAVVYTRDRLIALVGTLRFQATHDELTALPNRHLFTEKVGEALTNRPGHVAVVLVDLDGFKDINDSFGHDIGDRLLRTVGARIHRTVPPHSVVARLGSDEFAVLLTDLSEPGLPERTAARLELALTQPVDVDGRRLRVQAGIGIAQPVPGASAIELMRDADVALNAAKDRGKGHSAVFEPGMHDRTRERTELSADLVQALDAEELSVVYQPIVDLHTNTIHGVEALVRWEHAVRGSISPTVFVPLAEATGLIAPIGRWVLEQSCAQLAAWQAEFPGGQMTMDVNLSTDQLGAKNLVSDVLGLVAASGIDATALVLEITESALVRDIETALARLEQLALVGLRIALDDFGTGYSSLSYLRRLPVTVLKIDKSFVDDADADPHGRALLKSIVDLGAGQGMQIIVEGIETSDQAERLSAAGCHLGQGYLWSRPLPAEQVTAILRRGGLMRPTPSARSLALR